MRLNCSTCFLRFRSSARMTATEFRSCAMFRRHRCAPIRLLSATMSDSVLRLPNTLETWPKARETLRRIRDGEAKDVDTFEKLYALNESPTITRARAAATPQFVPVALRRVLRDGDHVSERHFLDTLLPWVAGKALDVEQLFLEHNHQLPLLLRGVQGEVVLTRVHVSCLLSLAFFGLFPPPSTHTFQHFLLTHWLEAGRSGSQRSKLLCLLTYFDRVRRAEIEGQSDFLSLKISVQRRGIERQNPDEFWGGCGLTLVPFSCEGEGLIEDSHGNLQVDFANQYVGGGVLELGNVQEEIRFSINPECLVSMLVCEVMSDNEAILITGAEQFAEYSGYGFGFNFAGPHTDTNPIDDRNIRCVSIVAIDALPQGYVGEDEFEVSSLARDLDKAFCGFGFVIAGDDVVAGAMKPVATGNWGCGAFGGSKELKTLQQWMAATRAGRPVKYYSFKDKQFSERQAEVVGVLMERKATVGQLYKILVAYSKLLERTPLFDFVKESVATKGHT